MRLIRSPGCAGWSVDPTAPRRSTTGTSPLYPRRWRARAGRRTAGAPGAPAATVAGRIGGCADADRRPVSEARADGGGGGVLEGVAVALLDERLGVTGIQLGDDPPAVAPPRELLVGVLHPDDGDPFPPRPLDEAAHVGDDRVALVRPFDDAVLHVDDKEAGVR